MRPRKASSTASKRTSGLVFTDDGTGSHRWTFRVGQHSTALYLLLAGGPPRLRRGIRTAAFICTVANPDASAPGEDSDFRQQMKDALPGTRYEIFAAEFGVLSAPHRSPGVLIVGITDAKAAAIARRFKRNFYVYVGRDGLPKHRQVFQNPRTFRCLENDQLVDASIKTPVSRADLYGVSSRALSTPSAWSELANQCPPFREMLLQTFGITAAADSILKLLSEANQQKTARAVKQWLSEWPADADSEAAYFAIATRPDREAMTFFEQLPTRVLDALGVAIVEGEHPGSSFYAAVLEGSIAKANAMARELNMPLRFTRRLQ